MSKHVKAVFFVSALFLVACAQNHSVPPVSSASSAAVGARTLSPQSVVTHGDFTEYSLPAGVNPSDLTRGPYGTIYFTNPGLSGVPSALYQMASATGQIHTFKPPSPYVSSGFDSIISLNRSVTYIVKIPINEDEFFFAHVTPEGTFTFTGAPYFEFGVVTNLALAPSGTSFTYGYCADPCLGATTGIAAGVELNDGFIPRTMTGGPNGNYYVTATEQNPSGAPTDSRVYVISPATNAIVNTFDLPNGASPAGIAVGPDRNLWVAEPGLNEIARVTPSGTIAQFPLPTANAGPDRITGASGAPLFFTEKTANKIGRITTSGSVTEYPIPTAGSQPSGIAPCTTSCGVHGGAWFTETAGNKIGRFNSPI